MLVRVCVCVCVCPFPGVTYKESSFLASSCFVFCFCTNPLLVSLPLLRLLGRAYALSLPLLPPDKFHNTNAKCIIVPTKSAGMSKSTTFYGYQADWNLTNFPKLDVRFSEFCQLHIESRNQTPDIDLKRLRHGMVKLPLVSKLDIV